MKSLLLLFIVTISLSLNAQTTLVHSQGLTKSPAGETTKKASCSYTIIPSANNTWGYDIYMGKHLLIHQPCIPGLPGNKGFQNKTIAEKAAKLETKKITNAVIFYPVALNSPTQAGNTWVQKTNVGGLARYGAVGFSIGSKGYIGLGNPVSGPNWLVDFWEYDTTSNSWTQKANFGGPGRQNAVGFCIGSKGYIGTGAASGTFYTDFWEYDPVANTWTQKANFAGGARRFATGFSTGTKGYIGTGNSVNGNDLSDFWEYDPSANNWTQKADFGGGQRIAAVGFSIGTKGYIGTGYSNNGFLKNDFWEYDPSTNIWTQKANFGGIIRDNAVGFCIGTRGYIGTGWNSISYYLNDFWEYDPYSNTWTQKANFGGGNRGVAVGFSIGDKGYIGTGNNSSFEKDFWAYYPGCTQPPPPTNTTPSSNQNICIGNSTTLSASGTGILGWYNAATGGTWLGGGMNYTTPILTMSTTYYVQDSTSCGASATRTPIGIIVNPLPVPTITGSTNLCVNSGYYNYVTEAGMTNYVWTVSSGGMINNGSGTNEIQVSWTCAGVQAVSVTYNSVAGCNALAPTVLNITVNPLPGPAGSITGTTTVCAGDNNVFYSVSPIANAFTYVWDLPPNASIASGMGTNTITVNFEVNASSGDISVYGNNLCGNGIVSPNFPVNVKPIPPSPIVNNTGDTLSSSAPIGNQWYYEGILLAGDTSQIYVAAYNGYYWDVVTVNGCSSDTSNHLLILIIGVDSHSQPVINVYPVPGDGWFFVSITNSSTEPYSISVYNTLGIKIYEETKVEVYKSLQKLIDLRPIPNGIYTVIFENNQNQVVKKIIVNK